jgi:hypothetical protein
MHSSFVLSLSTTQSPRISLFAGWPRTSISKFGQPRQANVVCVKNTKKRKEKLTRFGSWLHLQRVPRFPPKVKKRPSSMGDPTRVEISGRWDQNMHSLEVFNVALSPGVRVRQNPERLLLGSAFGLSHCLRDPVSPATQMVVESIVFRFSSSSRLTLIPINPRL